MKKILISYLVLLGLILCSCNAAVVPNTELNESDSATTSFVKPNEPSSDNAYESTESDSQLSTTLPGEDDATSEESALETTPSYTGDPVWFRLSDYTLYQKWIETAELPDNFVSYEQIKELGEEFYDFVIRSAGDDFTVYHYTLKINGRKVMVEIKNYEDRYSLKSTYEGTVPQDLRQIVTAEPKDTRLMFNGIEYLYGYGKDIYDISWIQKDLVISVKTLYNIIDVPTSELPPALAALLDSTTAADALASIKKSINTPFTEFFTTVEDTTIADTIISIEETTTVEENTTTAGGNQSEPKGGCSGSVISSLFVLFIVGCAGALVYKKR